MCIYKLLVGKTDEILKKKIERKLLIPNQIPFTYLNI